MSKNGTLEYWIEETQHDESVSGVEQDTLTSCKDSGACVDVFHRNDGTIELVQFWFSTESEFQNFCDEHGFSGHE